LFIKHSRKNQRTLNRTGQILCEICKEPNILVQHHIHGRKVPNANSPANLANICASCHMNVHSGIIIIENKMLTSIGYQLIWHSHKDPSITGNDAKSWLI